MWRISQPNKRVLPECLGVEVFKSRVVIRAGVLVVRVAWARNGGAPNGCGLIGDWADNLSQKICKLWLLARRKWIVESEIEPCTLMKPCFRFPSFSQ